MPWTDGYNLNTCADVWFGCSRFIVVCCVVLCFMTCRPADISAVTITREGGIVKVRLYLFQRTDLIAQVCTAVGHPLAEVLQKPGGVRVSFIVELVAWIMSYAYYYHTC